MGYDRVLIRPDTSTNWSTNNPLLVKGEMAIETDTGLIKIGDGSNNYNDLKSYMPKYDSNGGIVLESQDDLTLTPASGKDTIVTSQLKISGASRASYTTTTATTITSTVTVIPYDTKDYDNLDEWDTSSHRFIPAEDGFYQVSATFLVSASFSAGDVVWGHVSKNGSIYQTFDRKEIEVARTEYVYIGNSVQIYLTTSDYLDIRGQSTIDTSLYSSATYNRVSVHRLS